MKVKQQTNGLKVNTFLITIYNNTPKQIEYLVSQPNILGVTIK